MTDPDERTPEAPVDDYGVCPCGNRSVGWRFVASVKGLDPAVCPSCGERTLAFVPMPDEVRLDVLRREREAASVGWSSVTVSVPFRHHRDEVTEACRRAEFGPPTANRAGTKVNREARFEGWHLGVEESASSVDGATILRGFAEHEGRNVKVRWPVALVDEVRRRICPEALGRSE